MSERRRQQRLSIKLEVELQCDGTECLLKSKDLSNSGVFLEKDQTCLPEVGSIVYLRIKQDFADGEPPLVKARVVRIQDDGIALTFLES